ncbi:MAG: NAD(P)/FAD-dependent oxidoreductase [Candidatus Acidiferrales bacterium]
MTEPHAAQSFDAIVMGGGAAGLMCAIEAGKRGRRVAVLERAERCGKKILISGGGRCNFTNIYTEPENFLSANDHFAKSALARYTPADFIALVEKHGIRYHEKKLGQLFCDRAAQDILTMLEAECRAAGVKIFRNCHIKNVARVTEFVVGTSDSEFRAPALVVATGGLSIPKMGATAFGYQMARLFGLKVRKTSPGLVPFVLNPTDRASFCDLAGVAAEVTARGGEQTFHESMLITHRGLSGPAILQISSYWTPGEAIHLDLAPGRNVTSNAQPGSERAAVQVSSSVQEVLPRRLAIRWLETHVPPSWSHESLATFEAGIHDWKIVPAGTEGYEKAEITTGGVDTAELSSKTMESHKVAGLFFIGEVVDVTGHLGGFNFQWAWASGAAAGRAL